jgi:hypothetical protein
METTIYKIELSKREAVIYTMTTKGNILGERSASVNDALRFARMKGLSCMEDDGEMKCYW